MTVLDQPQQISMWYVLSAVSQLGLELQTGQNYYGKTSVYKGIRMNLIDGLPPRATKQNKCLALATLLQNLDPDTLAGPVCTRAREILDRTLAENGWAITG